MEEEYLTILDQLPCNNQFLSNDNPNKFIAKMGAEALEIFATFQDSALMICPLNLGIRQLMITLLH